MLNPSGLAEPLGRQGSHQTINLRIARAVLRNEAPTSDKALIARQISEAVGEVLVALTGRARRSKGSGDVPTQQSQAFVCSKHVFI